MARLSTVLSPFVDRFLNDEVLRTGGNRLFQARFVAIVIAILLPICAVLFCVDLSHGNHLNASITVGFMLFCLGSLAYSKKTGRYQVIALAMNIIPVFTLTRASFFAGGLFSIYTPIFFALPTTAFLMARKQGGIIVSVLAGAAILLIGLFATEGPNVWPVMIASLITVVISASVTLSFSNLSTWALHKANKANAQLEETNQALTVARQEAELALQFRSAFLATMSHEIRTPMNGVIGMTSLLGQTTLSSEQREYIDTIRVSGSALLTIINDILDFSKIESGALELEEHPFSVSQCIEESLDLLALKAAEKGLELAYQTSFPEQDRVIGDITRLRQILVNLLSNAIKFTEKGSVTVEADLEEVDAGTRRVVFSVTDTGIGIPEDRMSRLFEPFRQVDASTTRHYGGTGLGLAISKCLCEAMGGQISVKSTLGEGSTFTVYITVGITREQEALTRLDEKHIGIVGQESFSRNALEAALGQRGAQVSVGTALPDAEQFIVLHTSSESLERIFTQLEGVDNEPTTIILHQPGEADEIIQSERNVLPISLPIKPEKIARLLADNATAPTNERSSIREALLGQADVHPLRILLVEDNAINQKVAQRQLTCIGYESDVAGNGLEAIQALSRQPYEVVLMDVKMPVLDGITATEKIRAIDHIHQPYIIGFTANAMQEELIQCKQVGMDDVIIKPVVLEELADALARANNCSSTMSSLAR